MLLLEKFLSPGLCVPTRTATVAPLCPKETLAYALPRQNKVTAIPPK